jgi:hypothetical protein
MSSGVSGLIFLFRTTSTHEEAGAAADASPSTGAASAAADTVGGEEAEGDEEEGDVEGPAGISVVLFLE